MVHCRICISKKIHITVLLINIIDYYINLKKCMKQIYFNNSVFSEKKWND